MFSQSLPPGGRKPARPLQQQAQRPADRQQQQNGSSPDFQQKLTPVQVQTPDKAQKPV